MKSILLIFWIPFLLVSVGVLYVLWTQGASYLTISIFVVVFLIIFGFMRFLTKLATNILIAFWLLVALVLLAFAYYGTPLVDRIQTEIRVLGKDERYKAIAELSYANNVYIEGEYMNSVTNEVEDIKVWMKGSKYRQDVFKRGKLDRTLLAERGDPSGFWYHEDGEAYPSYVDANFYIDQYRKIPENDLIYESDDTENGCIRYRAEDGKLYSINEANNEWYQSHRVYCIADRKVLYIENWGGEPGEEGGDYQVTTIERITITDLAPYNKVDDEVFDPPND